MRGRKPKPTKLKLIAGNPGHRPLNDKEPEIEPATSKTEAPKELKGVALDEWNKQLDYLTANGIVGENEISILEDYCLLFQRIREDISMGRQISAGLLAQLRGYRADLGIGPSVRSKFKTDKPKQPANHWAGLANS